MAKADKKPKTAVAKVESAPRDLVKVSAEDFPRRTIEEAVRVAAAIFKNYGNQPANWKEIASLLGVSASTQENKYPLWSAEAYGMLSRNEDHTFQLVETGRKIVAPEYPGEDTEGKVKALLTPKTLSKFFTDYNGRQLPESQHFPNVLHNRYGIPRERAQEAIRLIIDNGKYAGVLEQQPDGSNLVRIDSTAQPQPTSGDTQPETALLADGVNPDGIVSGAAQYNWAKTCFFITPIGDDNSEQRKHADLILKHVLTPVAEEFGLQVVRADKIERSGLITQQIFEQIVRAKLCVADLSFNNPNVFYELGVRHTCKLPTIQLIRKGDKIPFDVAQGRTIQIDTSDAYSIIDRVTSAQNELRQQVRHIMGLTTSEPSEDNPVHLYLPKLRVTVG